VTDTADRAAALTRLLRLVPHPEGGFYAEIFRSARTVHGGGEHGDQPRAALTSIDFLLVAGGHSRWHRVEADEAWHHHEGAVLELLWIDAARSALHVERLGPVDGAGTRPSAVVPAGCWQAARTTGAYTLVGCTVGPGFDFADFARLDDRPAEAAELRARFAEVRALG
jgi:predicted cupin superfamily sugar epimerase